MKDSSRPKGVEKHFGSIVQAFKSERYCRNAYHMFFAQAYSDLPTEARARFFELVEERARPMLWREDHWIADYVRLRIVAEKT